MPAKTCKWTYCEFHDCWDMQCGNDFTLMNGTPTDNKMVYCPYCGKKIVAGWSISFRQQGVKTPQATPRGDRRSTCNPRPPASLKREEKEVENGDDEDNLA